MVLKEGENQEFRVKLYMANCASALVLDTLGSHVTDVKVYTTGFATGFCVADSLYRFPYTPIVRTNRIRVGNEKATPLCFVSVNFPSRDLESKTKDIGDNVPEATEVLWSYRVYCTTEEGTITETRVGVLAPLGAAQFKVVRANITTNGAVAPLSSSTDLAVSVTLDWKPGMDWNVEF